MRIWINIEAQIKRFQFSTQQRPPNRLTHELDGSLTPSHQRQKTWPRVLLRPPEISQRCVCHSLHHLMTEGSCNKSTTADMHKTSLPAIVKWERNRVIPPLSSPLDLAPFIIWPLIRPFKTSWRPQSDSHVSERAKDLNVQLLIELCHLPQIRN